MPATLDASMELTILGSQPDDPDGRSGLIGVDDEADFVVVAIDHAGRILVVRPFELGKPNYVGESIRDAYAERGDASGHPAAPARPPQRSQPESSWTRRPVRIHPGDGPSRRSAVCEAGALRRTGGPRE
jgi:hypothetical protein